MPIIRLTSAVAARATIYVNTDHISFSDQSGGCALKTVGGASGPSVIAVTEPAETVFQRIMEAELAEREPRLT